MQYIIFNLLGIDNMVYNKLDFLSNFDIFLKWHKIVFDAILVSNTLQMKRILMSINKTIKVKASAIIT